MIIKRVTVYFFLALLLASLSLTCAGDGDKESNETIVGDDTVADDSVSDDSIGDDTIPSGPPDIVVIMADDLELESLQILLDEGRMPNLKELIIDHATEFTESFVSNPLCCPSRATFFTGQFSHNNNVLNNQLPIGGVSKLDDSSTVATWLHNAGYRTGLVGKYLNGYGTESSPTYLPPGWDDWQPLIYPDLYTMYGYQFNDNGTIVTYGDSVSDYQTDVVAERAADFISESAGDDQPFFLLVTPASPHTEFPETWFDDFHGFADWYTLTIRPPARYESMFDRDIPPDVNFNEADVADKPDWVQVRPLLNETDLAGARKQFNDRLGAIVSIDDLIGTVGTALSESGRLDNTVLIFVSDNGFFLGKHRVPQKTAIYEEALRVPLYIRAPGYPKQTSTRMVLNTDWALTLADFAGAEPDITVDGRSLAPLLPNPEPGQWRRRFLAEHWGLSDVIFEVPTYAGIRTGADDGDFSNLLYVQYSRAGEVYTTELYDMILDPYQLQSLHQDPDMARVRQRERMAEKLAAFQECSGDECRQLEDEEW
jgi:N-acetylglucosamine-6-sulfatase